MKSPIRKLSIGPNYKSDAMHYILGNPVVLLGKTYRMQLMIHNSDTECYEIWLKGADGIVKWKEFNKNMPVSVEYDVNI